MIAEEVLTLLCCPATHQPLAIAPAAVLAQIEAARVAGTLCDVSGKTITDPIDGALIRTDGALAFPIRGGIPVMLIDEALPLGVAADGA